MTHLTTRRAVALFLLLPLALAMGCKNFFVPVDSAGNPILNTGDYAYIVSANTASSTDPIYSLTGFSVGSGGALTALGSLPITFQYAVTTAVVTPSNNYLYVAGSGDVYGYAINSNGTLSQLFNANNLAVLQNANVLQMVVSPDGNWLLGIDGTSDGSITTIDEFQIASNGQLSAVEPFPQYSITGGATIVPNGIAISKDGNFVAVALGTGGDVLFSFDTSNGTLAQVSQVDTGSSSGADQAVAFDSTSSILFVAQSGSGQGVYPFVITNNGATLTAAAAAPFALGAGASSILVDATGNYLYVGNKTSSTISGFSIGSNGVLTSLGGSAYTAGTNVSALAEDSTGAYILSTSLGAPDLKVYGLGASGELTPITTKGIGDPTEPAGAVAVAVTHPAN